MIPEDAAERGAEDEADAEGGAELPELSGALLGRRDIRDVGEGGRIARRGDPRDDAADEEPAERRRDGHDEVVESETERREQDHAAPSEVIGDRADHRREEELRPLPDRTEDAVDERAAGGVRRR